MSGSGIMVGAPRFAALDRIILGMAREQQSLLKGVIDAVDYLEGWLRAASSGERNRVEHLRRQLLGTLLLHGVRPTAKEGRPLDLGYHEVVATVPTAAVPTDIIVEVVEMGYELVAQGQEPIALRRAKVSVAAPAEQEHSDRGSA